MHEGYNDLSVNKVRQTNGYQPSVKQRTGKCVQFSEYRMLFRHVQYKQTSANIDIMFKYVYLQYKY